MFSGKKWSIVLLSVTIVLLLTCIAIVATVDPYFHYHKPLKKLQYIIYEERYQNDGIVKHFDYDAIITGSSMTENFKVSEFNDIWGVNSIKVPFSGGSYKEINDNLKRSVARNKDLKYIIRGLDYSMILDNKDHMRYESYPEYLYDDVLINDIKYVLDKSVFFAIYDNMVYTWSGGTTTSFDNYANWNDTSIFGSKSVLKEYTRPDVSNKQIVFDEKDRVVLEENFNQNVISLAKENPQITFYLFWTPYSICYWDEIKRIGKLNYMLEAEKQAIELLLEEDNIRLYSFNLAPGLITNLNNYKDPAHYGEDINSQILQWMYDGEYLLTKNNYHMYLEDERKLLNEYDYELIFTH